MLICRILPQKVSLDTTISSIPGDKSISHRAFILGGLCENSSRFSHILESEDCLNTCKIMQQLGVSITKENGQYVVEGRGLRGLKSPGTGITLDVGNSGTSIRLLTGLLAAQSFETVITGDTSIQGRPMKRIVDPLTGMGARISGQSRLGSEDIFPPLRIQPVDGLSDIDYALPMASAQVKSAVLLAGLYTDHVSIDEPEHSRDHTERLMSYYGAPINSYGKRVTLQKMESLKNPNPDQVLRVPGDISSALFFIALSVLAKKSVVQFTGIGDNQTRNAALDCITRMHGRIRRDRASETWEPTINLEVQSSELFNTELSGDVIPNIIDEIPILSVLGLSAKGTMKVRDAEELRVKESDRINSIVRLIEAMGCSITEYVDGFDLEGEQTIQPFYYDSGGDHRMAMSAIIGALAAGVEATVENCDCIATSFPNFFDILKELGISFEVIEQ